MHRRAILMKEKSIFRIFRFIIYTVPIIVFSWLVYKDLVISGILEAEYDFSHPSPFISVLRPQGRLSEIMIDDQGNAYQKIVDQPVYFDVRLPRRFDTATVRLRYKNSDQRVFEIGAMVDKRLWQFDLKPVENKIIDYLFYDKFRWSSIRSGDTILFQKDPQYRTVEDFLNNLPPTDKIAVYHYKLPYTFSLPGYQPQEGGIEIHKSLRGFHRFYTYIKNEPLDFTFLLQDVNRHRGDDYMSIDVYSLQNDAVIDSEFIKIDENVSDNAVYSKTQEVRLHLSDLPEGVYRIDLVTPSDDIFIRSIRTEQDLLVFINKIYLADSVGYSDEFDDERRAPTQLYTNGSTFFFKTAHIEGIQSVLVDDIPLKIERTHEQYSVHTPFGEKRLFIPQNDIIVETRGLFAFSELQFFNPEITSLSDGMEFDSERIAYVIANYRPGVSKPGGWKEQEIVFPIERYYTADRKLHFVLSLPFLKREDEGVILDQIGVTLKTEPLTLRTLFEKIMRRISLLWL